MKNPAEYLNQVREMLGVKLSQYSASMGNSVQSIQNSVNTWTGGMREYWKLSNGLYGPAGRVLAIQMRLKNPDIGAVFDPPPTYTPQENSAERQRDQTTPAHQKNLVDRLNGEERRNSAGGKYSEKRYNESRYRDAAYADSSKRLSGLVYLSKEAFIKLANDALKRIRPVYQNRNNTLTASSQAEYDPLRNPPRATVLQFPTRENTTKYASAKLAGSVDDVVDEAA